MLLYFTVLVAVVVALHVQFSSGEVSYDGAMADGDAIMLLKRHVQLTMDLKLKQYVDEMREIYPTMQDNFTDTTFTVVGSLAAVDATITFVEGVNSIKNIRANRVAVPTSHETAHKALPGLNAARNVLWLLKEKLEKGIVSNDASLIEKLEEAQVWLSTQTGGHLGQLAEFSLASSGITGKLQRRWGMNSPKMTAFNAFVSGGPDLLINGFNTAVNAMKVHEEATPANILALTSSVTAMASDIAMGVGSALVQTAAFAGTLAGPIGMAIGAALVVISYGTGVASGLDR